MKNLSYVINGVLAVAIVILYVLHFSAKGESSPQVTVGESIPTEFATLPVAYINIDSLLGEYNYSKDLNEAMIRKSESARLSLNQKGRQLEQEVGEFQKKVENNAFLSTERGEQERNRLIRKQQELQQLSERLSADISQETQQMTMKLNETIMSFIREYNASKKYQIIFNNVTNDNILLADKKYDITSEIITELNKRYSPTASGINSEKK